MLGTPFTHDMIRKYVVAFGTMFNNIKLQRIGATDTQWISVPLSYAPKEKWHARLTDPNITQQIAISLPRISYELVTAVYAPDRKMNTLNRHVATTTDPNKLKTMYAPVPYDLQFSLYVYSRNAADASNIIEQILPFFTPEFTVTINNATDMDIDIDCPIILNSVSREDTYEGDFESRRVVTWSLDFTMKGLLFGPVREEKIIKKAYVDFFIPNSLVSYHSGTFAKDSVTTSEIFLQANTSSRANKTYDGGTITITGEGSDTTGITGNTRNIISYNGSTQRASIAPVFEDTPQESWTYQLQYSTSRSALLTSEQLPGTPTASRIYTQPGLTGDYKVTTPGDPTNKFSFSVDIDLINSDDDFGIIQTHTVFPPEAKIHSATQLTDFGVVASSFQHGSLFPSWNLDGTKIIFSTPKDNGAVGTANSDIYTASYDKATKTISSVVRLTGPESIFGSENDGHNYYPSFSPNDNEIIFSSDRDDDPVGPGIGTQQIYMINADGSNPHAIESNDPVGDPKNGSRAVWSPDGGHIAFSTSRDGRSEIYIMRNNGTDPINITNIETNDYDAAWSPDGTKIAFRSDRSGMREIWVMDVDQTNLTACSSPTQLTFGGLNTAPSWSSDGTQISFISSRDTGGVLYSHDREVYVMNADGSKQTNLTLSGTNETGPARWSPDGTQIVWMSLVSGKWPEGVYETIVADYTKSLAGARRNLKTGVDEIL